MTDIPAIGIDTQGGEIYAGYCKVGDKISFKVLDASTGELISMNTDVDIEWSNMLMSVINLTDQYIPTEIGLGNAYPNPFNPVTILSYDVPFDMNISLGIFDLRGRLVKQLVNEIREPGRYEVIWNANEYASGVYMVKLVSGNTVKVQKIMLVK